MVYPPTYGEAAIAQTVSRSAFTRSDLITNLQILAKANVTGALIPLEQWQGNLSGCNAGGRNS
jgi:hypothetical protein